MLFEAMHRIFSRYVQPIITASGIAVDTEGFLFEAGKPQVKFFNNEKALMVIDSDRRYRDLIEVGMEFEVFSPFTNIPHAALLCRFILSKVDGEYNDNPIAEMFQSWELEDDSINKVEFGFRDLEDGRRLYFLQKIDDKLIIAEGAHEEQTIGMWILCINALRSIGLMEMTDAQLEMAVGEIVSISEDFKVNFRKLKMETLLLNDTDFAQEELDAVDYDDDYFVERTQSSDDESTPFDPMDFMDFEDYTGDLFIPSSDDSFEEMNRNILENSLEFDMTPSQVATYQRITGNRWN